MDEDNLDKYFNRKEHNDDEEEDEEIVDIVQQIDSLIDRHI